jgi:integrase/recombinase XerD
VSGEIVPSGTKQRLTTATSGAGLQVPALIDRAGQKAAKRFIEFFVAQYRNPNTREAYARAVGRFFAWSEDHGLRDLDYIEPLHVAAYVEELGGSYKVRTVKQHMAAIRMCLDYLVTGGILPTNPAMNVRGPKLVAAKGVTPVLDDDQVLDLLESIDTSTIAGLRDRALLGVMLFSWARVSAVCGLRIKDYESSGRKTHLFLGEKGGKEHRVLLHHKAEEFLDAYVHAAEIGSDRDGWLFRALDRRRQLSDRPLNRSDVLAMVKRRAKAANLEPERICNHSFRATGITNYMTNGGRIDVAKEMAGHADERTTGLYDRSSDKMTKEEVERMRFTREG